MKNSEYKQITENATFINAIGNKDLSRSAKGDMEDNLKSALIGGGVGVLIGIATKRNLIVFGLGGLVIGRFLLKIK